jgi:ATP-binding cassette subfamily F protein uup
MPTLLTLDQVDLAFGHLPLLEGVTLRVDQGERLALIGRNGSGKSSLLKILSGDIEPDGGSVWRAPGLRISRLVQDVPDPGSRTVREELAAGLPAGREAEAWADAHDIGRIVSRLSLPADRPMRELSGGWRRRVLLGRALVSSPDLLLLDEPTNHLDVEAIEWLEAHLRSFSGALLFVTHDRAFLRGLATRILELDRGRLTSWPGSYDAYVAKKAEALETEARDLERLDKKLAEEEAWLRRGIKARRTRDEGRVRALHTLRAERAAYRAQQGAVRMAIDAGSTSGKMVFELDHVSKTFSVGATHASPVVNDLSLRIQRGDRIGFIGPNGSGKTTLLRLLTGELAPDSGSVRHGARLEIAYFDQQREQLDPEQTVARSVSDSDSVLVNGEPRHVLGYLADFLFARERAESPVKSLSGGERNRLLLARLFARPANVLVLDEPTNDLDLETLDLLEELIAAFDGTVLLVTHDRSFLDNVVTSTLAFEGEGRITEYVGGWEDYVRQRPGRLKAAPTSSDVGAGFSRPKTRKRSFKEEREYAELPQRIEKLEAEQRRLREEMAAPEFYKAPPDRIREVLARLDEISPAIEQTMARWMELEEIAR